MPRIHTNASPPAELAKLSRTDRRILTATGAAGTLPIAGPCDLTALPVRVDRRTAAAIVTAFFFPISHRSIERWSLPVRYVGGYALYETRDLIAAAERCLAVSTPIRAGRRIPAAKTVTEE
jgi:hypothetical protein